MGKYRFRKMFFICGDKKIISPNTEMTSAYQYKKDADIVRGGNRTSHFFWEDKTKPVPQRTVEGFYLVHESLYEEILKAFDKDSKEG